MLNIVHVEHHYHKVEGGMFLIYSQILKLVVPLKKGCSFNKVLKNVLCSRIKCYYPDNKTIFF